MADENGILFFKYYLQKLKVFFSSKDILSFLLFFAISSGFWFIHALGKEREKTIIVPVHYVGVPLNLALTNNPPTEISLNIKDQGIRLFEYSDKYLTPLKIDLSRVFNQKGKIIISSEQLKYKVSKYLKSTTSILEIKPDSIIVQYEKLCQKTIPIKFYAHVNLAHQYMFSDRIKLQPYELTVFGPNQVLDTLKYIRTESLTFKNLNDTISFQCKLLPINNVQFSTVKTKVTFFVEQFTERKVQLTVTSLNCPENYKLKTFPAYVNASYTVSLSQFKTLHPSDILVCLDYNELKSDIQSKHFLKIINNSKYISNIRIFPNEVEYILEQK